MIRPFGNWVAELCIGVCLVGCGSLRGVPHVVTEIVLDHADRLRVAVDGRAEVICTYTHINSQSNYADTIRRTYVLACDVVATHSFCEKLQALSAVVHPELDGHAGGVMIELRAADRPVKQFAFHPACLDIYPFWNGVYEKVSRLASYDLAQGVFWRAVAEEAATREDWKTCSWAYSLAMEKLHCWRQRVASELPETFIDDSEGLLYKPAELRDAGQYHNAALASRRAWQRLATGWIRAIADGDTVTLIVRGPQFDFSEMAHLRALGYTLRGNVTQAEKLCREALAQYTRNAERLPVLSDYPMYVAMCEYNLAMILESRGAVQEAQRALSKSESKLAALAPDPRDPVASGDLAWFLASCAEPRFRGVSKAVRLARRAVELAPEHAESWEVLGLVLYQVRDYSAVIDALRRALELRDSDPDFMDFLLAMAYWQIADWNTARTWYDRAVRGMEDERSFGPSDIYWRCFHEQATRLFESGQSRKLDFPVVLPPPQWEKLVSP